jgi:hypothetical protein
MWGRKIAEFLKYILRCIVRAILKSAKIFHADIVTVPSRPSKRAQQFSKLRLTRPELSQLSRDQRNFLAQFRHGCLMGGGG